MAVNNQTPVQLQPSSSLDDNIAYINQNFRSLTDSLSPFKINDGSNDIVLLGKDSTGNHVLKVAKTGYDAFDATDDQLVMSSKFNMHKIIASGTATLTPRTGGLTLDATNIGYSFQASIDTGLTTGQANAGHPMIRVYQNIGAYKKDITYSGHYYDNGTNKAVCNFYYALFVDKLVITYNIRRTAGSVAITPTDDVGGPIYWEIVNQTSAMVGGMGGAGLGDSLYYYLDTRLYDINGVAGELISSKAEFVSGMSAIFPRSFAPFF